MKDAVYMQSRDQFEEYMRVMENRFYETAKLPKSPYVDSRSREGDVLPAYPPQGYGNTLDSNSKRGPRQAEQFID